MNVLYEKLMLEPISYESNTANMDTAPFEQRVNEARRRYTH
jgi:hypothetical protein